MENLGSVNDLRFHLFNPVFFDKMQSSNYKALSLPLRIKIEIDFIEMIFNYNLYQREYFAIFNRIFNANLYQYEYILQYPKEIFNVNLFQREYFPIH